MDTQIRDKNKTKAKKLVKMILKGREKIKKLDLTIFKAESRYLANTPNNSISKNADYYTHGTISKAKKIVNEKDRIFSRNYPK